jgi:hypothetical protein
MDKDQLIAKLEKDGQGEWGKNATAKIKAKQAEPIGILPKGAKPIKVSDLNGFDE